MLLHFYRIHHYNYTATIACTSIAISLMLNSFFPTLFPASQMWSSPMCCSTSRDDLYSLYYSVILVTFRQWYWSILGFSNSGNNILKPPVPPRVSGAHTGGSRYINTARLSDLYGTNNSSNNTEHLWSDNLKKLISSQDTKRRSQKRHFKTRKIISQDKRHTTQQNKTIWGPKSLLYQFLVPPILP